MKIKILFAIILAILLIPFSARAVTQETIDHLIFLLSQPELDDWSEGAFDSTTLYEGFTAIHQQAIDEGDEILFRRVLWAMGETRLTVFLPFLISSLDSEPIVVCYALGKISSEAGVYVLIGKLDDDDMYVREASAYALGTMNYISDMSVARDDAVIALQAHLLTEPEYWVKDTIRAAITTIETGVSPWESYPDGAERSR